MGILHAEHIRLELNGPFRVLYSDPQEEPFRLAGPGTLLEVRLGEGEIELSGGAGGETRLSGRGKEAVRSGTFLLEPEELHGCAARVKDVVIGIGFHWEQKEDQVFRGAIKLMIMENGIQVVNILPLEEYLVSVISSEMRGDSAPALLKAHTIISRSWLLAQIGKQAGNSGGKTSRSSGEKTEGEYIRWYDREDHTRFHVCADDHCQRYQGITRAANPAVEAAVRETAGQVMVYEGAICDARYSKCCGGVSEQFEYCWEPVHHPYLKRVDDNPEEAPVNTLDLKVEKHAVRFIESVPEAFCHTSDDRLLRQVLNDYDQSSPDFYRWTVEYSQEELSGLIREKSGIDFGDIIDLVPVQRGESARLVRLRIEGTRKTLTVGKELEIRRWLSPSHLYSSAFTVEKLEVRDGIPGRFRLRGAGWGHGVGLCQIGAAVMADRGYSHTRILTHYFTRATIEKRYE